MRAPEILRTPTFRLVGISSGAFALGMLVLFAFIYWQTAVYETHAIDGFIERQIGVLTEGDAEEMVRAVAAAKSLDETRVAFAGLFDRAGARLAGNLTVLPPDLPVDGQARPVEAAVTIAGRPRNAAVRAAAARLPDGRIVVIARSTAEARQLQSVVLRALALGVIPALGLALAAGALLSWRAQRRVRMVHLAAEKILRGNLGERLPDRGTIDDFDRLAGAVNRMLDEIERLLDEIKGVGGDIAHDLRTPLTRVRARLERGRESAGTKAALDDVVDNAIAGLDQTLNIITALLRITELEDGRRRAAFGEVDLSRIARDAAELYEPIAEAAGVTLGVEAERARLVHGDRDLLLEAVANLVDNAVKFTPRGGTVRIAVLDQESGPVLRVADTGPGIPPQEWELVLKRFYRSDKSRHLPGSGLGLGLVAAIVKLHNFRIAIGNAGPGSIFDIVCTAAPPAARAARQEPADTGRA
jgi:signal transduction histidine kinase